MLALFHRIYSHPSRKYETQYTRKRNDRCRSVIHIGGGFPRHGTRDGERGDRQHKNSNEALYGQLPFLIKPILVMRIRALLPPCRRM